MAARFESGSFESYGAVEAAGTDITVPDAKSGGATVVRAIGDHEDTATTAPVIA